METIETKYNVGDKFVVEISAVDLNEVDPKYNKYTIANLTSCHDNFAIACLNEGDVDKLQKYSSDNSSFNDGVEFAQRVYRKLEGLSAFELREIFGSSFISGGSLWAIIRKYTVSQIDRMVSRFKLRFEVGDELVLNVSGKEETVVLTKVDDENESYYFMTKDGATGYMFGKDAFVSIIKRRTGNRYNVSVTLRRDSK